ncbi:substrate-binding domain-containing protein [Bifidobacterium sp. 82T10]|uniref:Substrate-binding domain-containing protein n=1 Tax=Bifidobacterium miconis TaxID=2834435 RepID=A0ABS6WCZ6_9BIFI|nr:substrate-binding domain-containing protein [Bifidobacterium miconis]MBW3091920.1 substrate-binding domain-containing protein [Bifidobacterium miconis]
MARNAEGKIKVGEIARLAGVSIATVSKVVNGRAGVAADTRERIERIMAETGYSKPLVSTKTSQTIELVLTEVAANGTMAMINEATRYAQSMSIGVTVTQTGRGERSDECFQSILARNPLGAILVLSTVAERERALLQSRDIPFVIIDPVGEVPAGALGVGIDNWTGGLVATEHLIALGHRRIGIVVGPSWAESSQARYSGYLAAMLKAGIDIDPAWATHGDYDMSDRGYQAVCELLDLPAERRPTAIFCCNDITAVSAYRAAGERGLTLPRDLSVVGFDNVYPSQCLYPALTTVDQPFGLMARKAIDMILDARNGSVEERHAVFPTRLVVRESTAKPRA